MFGMGQGEFRRGAFPRKPVEERSPDEHRVVAMVGNPSEGYTVYGPFEDFDEAAVEVEGLDAWIVELYPAMALRAQRNEAREFYSIPAARRERAAREQEREDRWRRETS